MTEAVVAGALALALLNALPGLLGGWRWYRCEASRAFWLLLRVGQGSAVTFALAIGALAIGRLAIKRGSIGSLRIEELSVGRLQVQELNVLSRTDAPSS